MQGVILLVIIMILVPARRIAKWDKTQWSQLCQGTGGGGVSSTSTGANNYAFVSTIVFHSGTMYVGGYFLYVFNSTTDMVACVAKWDGNTLSKIDSSNSGVFGGSPGGVYAIAFDSKGTLYAGGYFNMVLNSAGGKVFSIYSIAKWNSTNGWSFINNSSGIYYPCFSIVVDKSDNIYFGGSFSPTGQTATVMGVANDFNGIVKLSGTTWSAVGNGNGGGVDVVSSLTLASNQPIYVMTLYSNKLYVGGIFTGFYDTKGSASLTPANIIAVYG